MSYVIALLQKKGGAYKTTTAINLLGALLELGYKAVVCDMDKEKPDASFWADNGDELINLVVPLYEDNPSKKIEELRSQNDFLILDTPPQLDSSALKGAIFCDFAIIPCGASYIEKKALEEAAMCALMTKKPYKFLASRVTRNTISARSLFSELQSTGTYFNTSITHSVAMAECQSKGLWIGSYAPLSNNHLQFREVAKELLETLGVKNA